jgi:hypothetical protein
MATMHYQSAPVSQKTLDAVSRRVRTNESLGGRFMKPTLADANRVYNRRYESPRTEIL